MDLAAARAIVGQTVTLMDSRNEYITARILGIVHEEGWGDYFVLDGTERRLRTDVAVLIEKSYSDFTITTQAPT